MGSFARLGKNTALVFVGNIGAKMIGFLMLPLYTRWLSVEDYGTTDIINVYVAFLLTVVSCCMMDSLFIFPKGAERAEQKKYLSSAFAFVAIALAIYAAISLGVSIARDATAWHNSFTDNVWLIYGLIAAQIIQLMTQQFVRSIDKMTVYSITGIVLTGTTALYSWLLIPGYGVPGFVLAMVLANLSAAAYSCLFSKTYSYFSVSSIEYGSVKKMLAYSIPLIPNNIMWWLIGALNRPILESNPGMHSIGIFAVANKFPSIIVVIFSIFSTSWHISVLEEYGKPDFKKFYNQVFRLVLVVIFVTLWAICLCAKPLVYIFASSDFAEAWMYIPVLSLGAVMQCFSGFFGTPFSAVRKSKYYFYSTVWGAGAAIVFNFSLIPLLGTMGAALSVFFSFAIICISRYVYSLKFVQIAYNREIIASVMLLVASPFITLLVTNTYIRLALMIASMVLFLYMNKSILSKAIIKVKKINYDKA